MTDLATNIAPTAPDMSAAQHEADVTNIAGIAEQIPGGLDSPAVQDILNAPGTYMGRMIGGVAMKSEFEIPSVPAPEQKPFSGYSSGKVAVTAGR